LQEAGQLYITGFNGTEFNSELEDILENYNPGGVVLFKRNIPDSREKLKKLITDIYDKAKSLSMPVPFICIDHEGGRVHRLGNLATHFPPPGKMNLLTDREIYEIYLQQAHELSFFGFNLIFGPVFDFCPAGEGHIGDRSFGDKPESAITSMLNANRALVKGGLITVPKHFPGHGNVNVDPHFHLSVVEKSQRDYEVYDLLPFKEAIKDGCGAIMSAHVLVRDVDREFPATLSGKWLSLLRNNLNFNGVIVSDDLCMKAVWDRYGLEDITSHGMLAGLDIFCICFNDGEFDNAFRRSFSHIAELAGKDKDIEKRVISSIERVEILKKSFSGRKTFDNEAVFIKGHELLKELEGKC